MCMSLIGLFTICCTFTYNPDVKFQTILPEGLYYKLHLYKLSKE